jgi:hypothetical protein
MSSPAHRRSAGPVGSGPRSRMGLLLVAGIAAVVIVVGGVAYALSGGSSAPHAATSASGGSSSGGPTTTVPPLQVLSVTPAASTTGVQELAPIQITFNEAISPKSPPPTLNPPVGGSWSVSGTTMTFHPAGGYIPDSTYQVTVPTTVVSAEIHKHQASLAAAYQSSFKSAPGSTTRVEQMLAELGYLPLQFVAANPGAPQPAATSTTGGASTTSSTAATTSPSTAGGPGGSSSAASAASPPTAASTLAAESTDQSSVLTVPEAGSLTWRYPNTPPTLAALWTPGVSNVIDQGAIMAFENANNMKMDGIAGPQVWAALVKAVATRSVTTNPYYYLVASKASPETLTVYENNQPVYSSLANTGVAGAPTPDGTWPVYDRYASTTMSGTNPDGSHYNDPGIPWVAYFHGGDAVHGFTRGSYGVPQSVGCVELPEANAAVVWKDDPYGTLVTVTG